MMLASAVAGGAAANEPAELFVGTISAQAFSPDGKLAATGGKDGSLQLWDPATGKEIFRAAAHTKGTQAVVFSPDGKWVLSAGRDRLIRIWEVSSRKEIGTLAGHEGTVTCLLFSPDGKELLSGSSDKTVRVWNLAERKEVRKFKAHSSGVESLGLTSDNKLVTTGQKTEVIKLGGNTIINTGADNPRLWNLATGKEVRAYDVEAFQAVVSFDRKFLATSGTVTTVTPPNVFQTKWVTALRDAATGKILLDLTTHGGFLNFSPDGKLFAGRAKNKLCLFETITGKEIYNLDADPPSLCTFAADGKRLAYCRQATPAPPGAAKDAGPRVSFVELPPHKEKWAKLAQEADPAKLWEELVSNDAAAGYRAVWTLAAMPDKAVPMLKERLKLPAAGPDPDQMRRLIADLDSDNFKDRQAATNELKKLRHGAEVPLRQALDSGKLSPEARTRIQNLLRGLELTFPCAGEVLRESRALHALDMMGTPEALALIRTYADGAPTSLLAQDARRILERRGK
jgi:WD40 repeat protein